MCVELNKTFRYASEAAESLFCNAKHIQAVCVGRRKTHGGYTWKYVETTLEI